MKKRRIERDLYLKLTDDELDYLKNQVILEFATGLALGVIIGILLMLLLA